jgi:hypothetical protein
MRGAILNERAKRIIGSILAAVIIAAPFGYVGWLAYRSRQLPPDPKTAEFVCLDRERLNCVWIRYRRSVVPQPEPHSPLPLPARMDPDTLYGRIYNWLFETPLARRQASDRLRWGSASSLSAAAAALLYRSGCGPGGQVAGVGGPGGSAR